MQLVNGFVCYLRRTCLSSFLLIEPGYCVLDIAIIVDSSTSSDINNYQSTKSFLTDIIKSSYFTIGTYFDRVALLSFSSSSTTLFDLQQRSSASDVIAGLSSLPQPYGPSNTPAGILQAFQVNDALFCVWCTRPFETVTSFLWASVSRHSVAGGFLSQIQMKPGDFK